MLTAIPSAAGALLAMEGERRRHVRQHPQLHRILLGGCQQRHGMHPPPQRNHR